MTGWGGGEAGDRGLAIRGAPAPSWGARVGARLTRRVGALAALLALGAGLVLVVGASWGLLWLFLGRAVAEPGGSAARWLFLGLSGLAIPGAMVALLPLVRRLVPVALQLMAEGEGARAGTPDPVVAGGLEPGEHVLASMALDEAFGPSAWAWSLVAVWIALTGSLWVIVWGAVLAALEPVMAAVYAPAAVVGLILAVWGVQVLVSLDVVSELVVGALPVGLAMVLWPIVPQGMGAAGTPLKVLLGLQALWVVVRLLGRSRGASLVLTTRGLRQVGGRVGFRPPRLGPVLRPVMISAGPAPLGERWLWSDEAGLSGVLFPILATARSVARVAASSGVELKVRPDARVSSGATFATVLGVFVLGLWYLLALLPPAHVSVSLALDLALRTDELSSSPGPVMASCEALASQHPLALVPRCMAAQGRALAGDPEGAAARLAEVDALVTLVPGVTKETLPRLVRLLVTAVERDLALRRRLSLVDAEGWEPAGEALAPYRRAMLTLFGWTGGDLPGQLVAARKLLEEARVLAPEAPGPPFMLAYLRLGHWARGEEVADSLSRLLERAEDERTAAKRDLEPLARGGPWGAAVEAMTSVRGLLSERQVARGLLVGRIEEGALSPAELSKARLLLGAVTEGAVIDHEAFGDLAVRPPASGEEFLERWSLRARRPGEPGLRAAKLWAQAQGTSPGDEVPWLSRLMRELAITVPVRLGARVLAEPGLAALRPMVERKEGGS